MSKKNRSIALPCKSKQQTCRSETWQSADSQLYGCKTKNDELETLLASGSEPNSNQAQVWEQEEEMTSPHPPPKMGRDLPSSGCSGSGRIVENIPEGVVFFNFLLMLGCLSHI